MQDDDPSQYEFEKYIWILLVPFIAILAFALLAPLAHKIGLLPLLLGLTLCVALGVPMLRRRLSRPVEFRFPSSGVFPAAVLQGAKYGIFLTVVGAIWGLFGPQLAASSEIWGKICFWGGALFIAVGICLRLLRFLLRLK